LPYDLLYGVKAASRIVELKDPSLKPLPVEISAIGLESKRQLPEIAAMIDVIKDVESPRPHLPRL